MKAFEFFVPCKPKGKGRPRFTKDGHAYTPKATRDFESLIKQYAKIEAYKIGIRNRLMEAPVQVKIKAVFRPLKSDKASLHKAVQQGAIIPYRKKPDADNIAKAVCDALNRVVYYDDNQIFHISVTKVYGEQEGLAIKVAEGADETL